MSESEPEAASKGIPMRTRTIGVVFGDCGGDRIAVEHVFAPEGAFECDDCGAPGHDPGMVGLGIDGDDRQQAYAMLSPEEALLIANRLTRAAELVLESAEDVPDVEREAARFAVPDDATTAEDAEEAAFIRTKQMFKDVWDAWNEVPEGHPSPVKKVARDLGMTPGMVGLGIDGDDRQQAYAMLSPEEALLIANRLTRAAELVLESAEDVPDVEREAARFAVPDDATTAEDAEEAAFIRTKQMFKDVWDAWNEVPEGHPSPVKKVARDLGMTPADVAEIMFPPEEFGPWDDSQEPDLP